MANRLNFFDGLNVDNTHLNTIQDFLDEAIRNVVKDFYGFGIVNGLEVSNTTTSSLSVVVNPGVAYGTQGDRMELLGELTIDVTEDYQGEQTAVTDSTKARWVTVFLYPNMADVESSRNVSSTGDEVFLESLESAVVRIVKGQEGGVAPGDPIGGGVILADIRRTFGQTALGVDDLKFDRRSTVTRDVSTHRSISPIDHPDGSVTTNKIKDRAVTPTKLDREYLGLQGGTLEGDVDLDGNRIKNSGSPESDDDLTNKAYVDSVIEEPAFNLASHNQVIPIDHPDGSVTPVKLDRQYVEKGGDILDGVINMAGHQIENLGFADEFTDTASAQFALDAAQGAIITDTASTRSYRLYVNSGVFVIEEIDFLPVGNRTFLTPEDQTDISFIYKIDDFVPSTQEIGAFLGNFRGMVFQDTSGDGKRWEVGIFDTGGMFTKEI